MKNDIKYPTYYDQKTAVRLGDIVQQKIWFRNHLGTIVYVPGISPFNKNMEDMGISEVGIRLNEGGFVSTPVDPETFIINKKIKFLRRGLFTGDQIGANVDPFENDDSFLAP